MSRAFVSLVAFAASVMIVGCSSAPASSTRSPRADLGASSSPVAQASSATLPPTAPRAPLSFPNTASTELPSGLRVITVSRPSSALCDVRFVVASGSAADGEHTGRALVTARILAEAAAGAPSSSAGAVDPRTRTFRVEAGVDRVVLATTVLPDALEATIGGIANAVTASKPSAVDVKRVAHAAATMETEWLGVLDGAGERLVRRDLFLQPIGRHPYAAVHPTADDLSKIDASTVGEHIRSSYVGSNMALVVTGPIASLDVPAIAERAFAHVSTSRPAPVSIDDPIARPRPRRILLVDSPKRRTVTITVGRLGPDPSENDSIATRLFGELWINRVVMAQKPEARPSFRLVGFREGPSLALFEASASPARAAALVGALLDHDLPAEPVEKELATARAAFDDQMALSLDRPGFLADALATLAGLGLPPSTLEKNSLEASTTPFESVATSGRKMLAGDEVAVVIGDAASLVTDLRAFGDVDIVDPTRDFERVRTERQASPAKLPTAPKTGDDSSMERRRE